MLHEHTQLINLHLNGVIAPSAGYELNSVLQAHFTLNTHCR